MKCFLWAARSGSLSAAARAQGLEQSTLSRRIRRLEGELRVSLFDRRPDGVTLTEAGRAVIHHGEQAAAALVRFRDAADAHADRPEGLVRVAATDSFIRLVLLPALPSLLETHPKLQLELRGGTELLDLTRRETDIAIRTQFSDHPELVGRRLARIEPKLYAASPRPPSLRGADWIGLREPPGAHVPSNHQLAQMTECPPRLLLDDFSGVLEAVRLGLGVGYLYPAMIPSDAGLHVVDVPGASASGVELFIVVHRALRRVPRVRAVLDWLERWPGPEGGARA
ncbi:MAG: LysR family transcriptional regulator [Myxococcota bacterium]